MFDLHLYLSSWGSRRFFLRLPKKLVDRIWLNGVLSEVDCLETRIVGEHLVVEISRDELEVEDFDDGAGQLAALAPLRANILAGDLRMFYLLWLMAVEADVFANDTPEPLPGVDPLDGTLEAFAEFFQIDADLIAAAAERNAEASGGELQRNEIDAAIRALSEKERMDFVLTALRWRPACRRPAAPARSRERRRAHARRAPTKRGRSANCALGPPRSPPPVNGQPRRLCGRNASGARQRRRRRAKSALQPWPCVASTHGAWSRTKSSGATPPAMIEPRPSSPICAM